METQQNMTVEQLVEIVTALTSRIETLEQKLNNNTKSQKEMTDNDALEVLTGRYKELNHNKAAEALKLSYGQIYSCRLEYTFRHIHKKIRDENANWVNPWKKK